MSPGRRPSSTARGFRPGGDGPTWLALEEAAARGILGVQRLLSRAREIAGARYPDLDARLAVEVHRGRITAVALDLLDGYGGEGRCL